MKTVREFNALTEIPENLSVEQLNQAVRDLREMLYQKQLEVQNLKELVNAINEEWRD